MADNVDENNFSLHNSKSAPNANARPLLYEEEKKNTLNV